MANLGHNPKIINHFIIARCLMDAAAASKASAFEKRAHQETANCLLACVVIVVGGASVARSSSTT